MAPRGPLPPGAGMSRSTRSGAAPQSRMASEASGGVVAFVVLINRYRRGQVLDRGADRLEERDLLGRSSPPDRAAAKLRKLAQHRLPADHAGLQRLQDVA